MFNLEQSISAWRKEMLAGGVQSPVPLDELESHLRDDIARQMQSGLDPASAFAAAVRQIGSAGSLKTEFKKVGDDRQLLLRKLLRDRRLNLYCWAILGITFSALAACGAGLFCTNKIPTTSTGRAWVLLAVASGVSIYFACWRLFPRVPVPADKRARTALQLAWGIPSFFCFLHFVAVSQSFAARKAPAEWAAISKGTQGPVLRAFSQLMTTLNGPAIPSVTSWSIYLVLTMLAFSIYFGIEESAQRRAATRYS